jgi:hypothetical protein
MALLDRLEKTLEELIERITDGVFRTQLQPVEIGKRLIREMETNRTVAPSSTFVPNLYVVVIGPESFAKFSMLCPPLLIEFETLLKQQLAEQHYKTIGPIAVRLQEDETMKAHEAKVLPISMKTPPPMDVILEDGFATSSTVVEVPQREPSLQETAVAGSTDEGKTMLLTPAAEPQTELLMLTASMEVVEGNEQGVSFRLRDGLRIGRGGKNDIPLTDTAVSRDHLEIVRQGAEWVVRDLGSANQTKVNGETVESAALHPGDEILIGRTKLVFKTG